MLIAQVSDPHVALPGVMASGVAETHADFERAVQHLLALKQRPDVLLITGDLVYRERPEEYTALRALLQPLDQAGLPVYIIPGNHDERGRMKDAFAGTGYLPASGPFLHYVVDGYPVRLIALDTHVPGQSWGELCTERLAWLESRLEEAPDRPTLLFMHHPPFAIGNPSDRSRCRGAEALGALLEDNQQVVRILCGHVHRAVQVVWHGVLSSTSPGPAYQIALNLDPTAPIRIAMEPPALQLHLWPDDPVPGQGMISHLSPIGMFAEHDLPR